jgi:predicted transcriptional regulator
MGYRINERNIGSYTLDGEPKIRRTKRIKSSQFNRIVKLENQLWDIQRKLYDLQSEFEDLNENEIAENIGMSGFELDEAKNKLNNAISAIKNK